MQASPSSLKTRLELSAILYDLDGTIADTDPTHFIAWQECLRPYGIEINPEFYEQRMSGKLNPVLIAELLPHLSVEESEQLADFKEARFRELARQLPPMQGLRELIDWASRRGLKQAVVTNAPRENVQFMLDSLKLSQVFDQVVIADDLGIGKPDPTPYTHTLEQLGLESNQAIAFEDSPSGVRSAVAAGIFTVGVTSTQTPEALQKLGVELAIADFTDTTLWSLLNEAKVS